MRNVFQAIAKALDEAADRPFETISLAAGILIVWPWLGLWSVLIFPVFLLLVAFIVDFSIYLWVRATYAKYRDTTVWVPGFHPFKAREIVRTFDRDMKKHGEEKVIAELESRGAIVTRKKKETL